MRASRVALAALPLLAHAAPILAQTTDRAAPPLSEQEIRARVAAHRGDFDYLLGDWRFDGDSKRWGRFHGYWSALRLPGQAQILDEYRVVGDSGETYALTTTIRSYNALRDEWDLVSLGIPNGLQDLGTGRREGDEVRIQQSFGVGGPDATLLRIRYRDIAADHFTWSADCSQDGGKSWIEHCQHLDVRRIGPARAVAPLTPPAKAGTR